MCQYQEPVDIYRVFEKLNIGRKHLNPHFIVTSTLLTNKSLGSTVFTYPKVLINEDHCNLVGPFSYQNVSVLKNILY